MEEVKVKKQFITKIIMICLLVFSVVGYYLTNGKQSGITPAIGEKAETQGQLTQMDSGKLIANADKNELIDYYSKFVTLDKDQFIQQQVVGMNEKVYYMGKGCNSVIVNNVKRYSYVPEEYKDTIQSSHPKKYINKVMLENNIEDYNIEEKGFSLLEVNMNIENLSSDKTSNLFDDFSLFSDQGDSYAGGMVLKADNIHFLNNSSEGSSKYGNSFSCDNNANITFIYLCSNEILDNSSMYIGAQDFNKMSYWQNTNYAIKLLIPESE